MTSVKFGEAVRQARVAKNMTLRALARAVECSAPFVSDVEHGRRLPTDVALWEQILGAQLSVHDPRNVKPAAVDELRGRVERLEAEVKKMRRAR